MQFHPFIPTNYLFMLPLNLYSWQCIDCFTGNVEWQDKQKSRCLVMWRSPQEWGQLIYQWVRTIYICVTIMYVNERCIADQIAHCYMYMYVCTGYPDTCYQETVLDSADQLYSLSFYHDQVSFRKIPKGEQKQIRRRVGGGHTVSMWMHMYISTDAESIK